jgi:3-dehydroquinate dehydratase-1
MDFEAFVLAEATGDLAMEPAARGVADAVELRMDRADDPLAQLDGYEGELPVLATNRAAWEGGEAGGDGPGDPREGGRLDALVAAAGRDPVAAVDVELRSVREGGGSRVVERARERGVAVVASVHDLKETPPADRLRELLADAVAAGDVGKLATTADDPGDVLRLLSVTREFDRRGELVATMAMGAAGRHSRPLAPVYGSRIGYAPVEDADATAPGQYDLETLADLVEQLR